MNQVATLRVISREPELKIVPLEQARAEWDALAGSHPEATLYHRGPWLEVLRRAFGVRPSVAIIGDSGSTRAACLLAQGGNPIRRSLISLPFSDFCPPLAVNDSARESLLSKLAVIRNRPRLEIRGAAGSYPWNVLYHFQRWTLDLSRPFNAIEKAADREVRRHLRRAREAGVTVECSRGAEAMDCFFESPAREPAPSRSAVAAAQVFQDGARGLRATRLDRGVVRVAPGQTHRRGGRPARRQ